mmetsp:Transcript_19788/g.29464  ORF Transcript_19788/g.29464 Transcript_19788/m.29464 type:complete len:113 (+) Transcript_19788:25-363(+)
MKLTSIAITIILIFTVFCLIQVSESKNVNLTPTRVTDPVVIKKLDCQMRCQKDEDTSPDCIYKCISPKCYQKVFRRIMTDGKISDTVSERRDAKFQKCWEKEAAELVEEGIL